MKFRPAMMVAVLGLVAGRARGYQVVERQDVDSLYYASQTVVKAEVGAAHPEQTADGDLIVYEVKVLEVLKGDAGVGKTYKVTGLDEFNNSPGVPGRADSWDRLQTGERVYLFAVPNGTTGYAKYRLVAADWTVVRSGARLEAEGNVYGFSQWVPDSLEHPRAWQTAGAIPFQVAMTPGGFPKALVYTEKEFHARVERARGVQAEVEKALKGDASEKQIQALVEMLRGRRAVVLAEDTRVDGVAVALARRLAEIGAGKPQVLGAVFVDSTRDVRRALEEGFATGAGAAYLLAQAADEKVPMEDRLAWAGVLTGMARAVAMLPQVREAGVPADLDVRLARLAMSNLDNALGSAVLQGLPTHLGQAPGPAVLTALLEGYARGAPPQQFAIADCVMQMDMRTYRDMFGGLGTFLTLVKPGDGFAAGLKQGRLELAFRYRGGVALAQRMKVVLRPVDGGGDRVLEPAAPPAMPSPPGTYVGSTFGGSQVTADLPADIPAGKYRVFLRVDGEGLGFEVEIPGK